MKHTMLATALAFICLVGFSQEKLVLQPGSEGKDAPIEWLDGGTWQNSNYGNATYLRTNLWTFNLNLMITRFLIEFDLTSIPKNSEIISAKLSLYHDGSTQIQSAESGSNEAFIQRITAAWDEQKVTWNNQPATTTENQATIPATISEKQNIVDLDITKLVNDVVNNYPNYGFLVKQKTEETFRRLHFASSDNANPALRPRLEVTYNKPVVCYTTVYDTIHVTVYDTVKVDVINTIPQYVTVTDTLVIDAYFSGKEQIKLAGAIKMYPNPTKSELNISIENFGQMSGYSIKILNGVGQSVFTTSIDKSTYKVSFDQFAKRGIYLVQIIDNKANILESRKIELQ